MSPAPNRGDFERALRGLWREAQERGDDHVDVVSGQLHRLVGGYPGPSHRMPICCEVMYAAKAPGDKVLQAPPKGKGASLVIRYELPRGQVPQVASRQALETASVPTKAPASTRPSPETHVPTFTERRGRVGLVGCVKQKLHHPATAADLYVSPLFRGRRRYVERTSSSWES